MYYVDLVMKKYNIQSIVYLYFWPQIRQEEYKRCTLDFLLDYNMNRKQVLQNEDFSFQTFPGSVFIIYLSPQQTVW